MQSPRIPFRPEGVTYLGAAVFLALFFAALEWWLLALPAALLALFVLNFFRDPERVVPVGEGVVVAPADGKVVAAGTRPDPFGRGEAKYVAIFMNVFNVHVNRAAMAGTVKDLAYHPGKYLNASLDKASEHNERLAVAMVDDKGRPWAMVQIAGLVARRIVCQAERGDRLDRGQRFGIIQFGSRVDLYLPHDYDLTLRPGDKTVAGETMAAVLRKADDQSQQSSAGE